MSHYNSESTAEQVSHDLKHHVKGKNIVITGVSPGGLGTEVTRVLAPYARLIYATGRSKARVEASVASVKRETPSANLKPVVMDLMSFDSIRKGAQEITEPIHILINNAAVAHFPTITRTNEGFEAQFGANHIGHFLLINLLLHQLREAATASCPSRIINVSSFAYTWSGEPEGIRWSDHGFTKKPEEYNRYKAYAISKTANILLARGLSRRFANDNIVAFSVHPGVVETQMSLAMPDDVLLGFGLLNEDRSRNSMWRTKEQGAATIIFAALEPSLVPQSGAFLADCQVLPQEQLGPVINDVLAAKLWGFTEKLLVVNVPSRL